MFRTALFPIIRGITSLQEYFSNNNYDSNRHQVTLALPSLFEAYEIYDKLEAKRQLEDKKLE